MDHPIATLKVGSLGTHHLLGLAKDKGATFLLASTSEVYGDPLAHPQPESYWGNVNPVGPRSVYDEAKRFAEAMTMAYHREHGVDVRIVRIFNTYGPYLRPGDGRAIPNFLSQALEGSPLTVYGDGSQTRSFTYVDDEVDGILGLLESDWVGPMNIGNAEEHTLLELAHTVLDVTGSSSEIVFEPLPGDDPKLRRPDITLASDVLGWSRCLPARRSGAHDGLVPRRAAAAGRPRSTCANADRAMPRDGAAAPRSPGAIAALRRPVATAATCAPAPPTGGCAYLGQSCGRKHRITTL